MEHTINMELNSLAIRSMAAPFSTVMTLIRVICSPEPVNVTEQT